MRALLLFVLLALSLAPAHAQRRVALVMGNASYTDMPLRNPTNDARLMESTLKRLGFEVERVENADFRRMQRAIRDFGNRAAGAEVALVFYAGHGMQAEGENYLIPVGAQLDKTSDLAIEAVAASTVLRQIEGAGPRVALVVLDACRNNPVYGRTRSATRGLARMDAPTGSIVAYAAQPGAVADDGDGANGLYTSHLARYLMQPGLDIKQVFELTAIAVEKATGNRQRPREDIGLRGAFTLLNVPAPNPMAIPTPQPQPTQPLPQPAPTSFGPPPTASVGGTGNLVVKLGHVSPTSGPIAHLGKDNELGARLAVDELNARGVVIGGRRAQFELVAENDASEPRQGVAAAQRLVAAGVSGVVGHLNSGTSIPAAKVYSEAGIPQVTPSATSATLTRQGYKTTFRLIADDVLLGNTLGRFAVSGLKGRSIAVVDDGTTYGRSVADEFEKGVRAAGGRLVSRQSTTDKAADFKDLLTSLQPRSPDIIFFGGFDNVAGPMLRQMRQLGLTARFLGGDGICSDQLPRIAAEGMSDGQVYCAESGGVASEDQRAMSDFKAKFKARFGTEVQVYAPYTYDAVNVLVAAMVKAGSAEPARYLPALARTSGYRGVTGPISFDDKGDLTSAAVSMFTYRGGKREQVAVLR